jgi:hypothetical protein
MDQTSRLKRLALFSVFILALAPLFIHYAGSPSWSWSSTTLYANSPGTHQGMCRMAYDLLRQDPAFAGILFPDLQQILNFSGVDADRFGNGLGPDDVRNSFFSEHYFNPRPEINSGRATFAVGEHFRKLRTDMNEANREGMGRLSTTARSAAYAAHYIQDMTMPYHTLGVPSNRVPGSAIEMVAFMQNPTCQAVMGPNVPSTTDIFNLVAIFRQDQRETDNRADWFEVWYYDGLSAATKRSTHFTYEWNAVHTQPLPLRGTSELWLRAHTAEKFAEETARITRRYTDEGGAAFDPKSVLVGKLLGLGVQQTYTIWRASFSALRIADLKLIKVPGKNQTYRTALIVRNQSGGETAADAFVEYVIMDSTYAPRNVAGPMVGALPPNLPTAVSPQELYIPNLMGKIRIILRGKFSNTPDSGFYQAEFPVKALIQDTPDRNQDYTRRELGGGGPGDEGRFDILGTEWAVHEGEGYRYPATFTRIGKSNVFEATFNGHNHPTNRVTITIGGGTVTMKRDQAPLSGDKLPRRICTYTGRLYKGDGSTDLNLAEGTLTCNFFGQYNIPPNLPWRAKILGQRQP